MVLVKVHRAQTHKAAQEVTVWRLERTISMMVVKLQHGKPDRES